MPERGSRLRVTLMIGSMREGGAEGQVIELLRGMRDRGHDVQLMILHPRGARLQSVLEEGFSVFGVDLPKLRPPWRIRGKAGAVGCLYRTVAELRRFRPHILHAWLFEAEAWAYLAKCLGAPGILVTSRRGLGVFGRSSSWKRFLKNRINRRASAVIANSKAVAQDCLRREKHLGKHKLRIIHNGVDAERFSTTQAADLATQIPALAGATHRVICIANLFAYKGHFDLLEAWRSVHPRFPDAHLLLVGRDDEIGGELARRISANHLEDRIHLLGPRHDIPALLAASDLLVLPSHTEGFPNVLLEAMAASLPVVTTNAGGSPEAVEQEQTALVVPASNPGLLAEAIAKLLENGELRRQLGQQGRRRVLRHFSLDRMVQKHEKLYRDLLQRRPASERLP